MSINRSGELDKVRRLSLRKAACVAIERRSVTLGDSAESLLTLRVVQIES
jgi:hypothetical protein